MEIDIQRILKNSIKCLKCEDQITSKHRHDFVMCKCSLVGVDGGNEYLRRIGDKANYIDCSIYDDGTHETRINTLRWGNNFDKNMNRLSKTEWILIKDMSTDHISAIIEGGYAKGNIFYEDIFKQELINRNNDKSGI